MTNYRFEIFHDVTSPTDLPPATVAQLRGCISSAFDGRITPEDAEHHMGGDQVLVMHRLDRGSDSVVAFSSTSMVSPRSEFADPTLTDRPGCYFAGAAIARNAQGNGLYHELNKRRIAFALENRADFIFTRTQNPRVQEAIEKALDVMEAERYLSVSGVTRVLRPGTYGQMLTREKPIARHLAYPDIDYGRGDAAIITWDIKRMVGRRGLSELLQS